jgi:hypothetical protein
MLAEWILQLQEYFEEIRKFIQQQISQKQPFDPSKKDIEWGDYGEFGIYPYCENFDGELDDFYIIYCNLEKEKRLINEKYFDYENSTTKDDKKNN